MKNGASLVAGELAVFRIPYSVFRIPSFARSPSNAADNYSCEFHDRDATRTRPTSRVYAIKTITNATRGPYATGAAHVVPDTREQERRRVFDLSLVVASFLRLSISRYPFSSPRALSLSSIDRDPSIRRSRS